MASTSHPSAFTFRCNRKIGTPKKRNVYDNRLQIQTLVNVKLYSNCLFEREDRIQSRGNTRHYLNNLPAFNQYPLACLYERRKKSNKNKINNMHIKIAPRKLSKTAPTTCRFISSLVVYISDAKCLIIIWISNLADLFLSIFQMFYAIQTVLCLGVGLDRLSCLVIATVG